jgi:hypothetical protein
MPEFFSMRFNIGDDCEITILQYHNYKKSYRGVSKREEMRFSGEVPAALIIAS